MSRGEKSKKEGVKIRTQNEKIHGRQICIHGTKHIKKAFIIVRKAQ